MKTRRNSRGQNWTAREDAFLGKMSDERLARKIGRSAKAVKARRNLKRISFYRHWSPKEDALLGTRSDVEVGRLVGRQSSVVNQRRRKLGIPAFQDQSIEKKLSSMTNQQVARLLRKSHRLRHSPPAEVRSKAPNWSPGEDELLGQWPDERLARFLGRTKKGVASRRQKLGIRHTIPGDRWMQEEIRLLDPKLIKGNVKKWTARLARKLDRSYVALKQKRRLVYGPMVKCRPWTPREVRMLGTRPDSEIAVALGRKCGTVQVRRGFLGIPSFRERNKVKWTPGKDRLLGTRSAADLAKHWGIGRAIVRERRKQLGVSSQIYRYWKRAEEKMIGTMPDKEVARRLRRTLKSVRHRRRALGIYRRAR